MLLPGGRSLPPDPQPLTVQFSVRFLKQFSERLQNSSLPNSASQNLFGGLLFGAAGRTDSTVQYFQSWGLDISAAQDRSAAEWNRAFGYWMSQRRTDPELAWLDLLGWFTVRPASTGELLPPDVDFHNTHFKNQNSLAVIFHSASKELIAADLYTTVPNSRLHPNTHRKISLHLALSSSPSGPQEPVIQPKFQDDFFLKAYEIAHALDRAERKAKWKENVRSLARLDWLRR